MYEFSRKIFYVILGVAVIFLILSISNWFHRPHSSKYPNGKIPKQKIELHRIWVNDTQIWMDGFKTGLGEQGLPASLPKSSEIYETLLFNEKGFNAYLSDRISLDRAIGDTRHEKCKFKKHLKKLPKASIIIINENEHWSVLLRTLHSIINRTPLELINQIIIIDDASHDTIMYEYIRSNLPKIHLIELKEPIGPILARLYAAKIATSEILVFLDSSIEVNYNWLPSLLEPIHFHPKTIISPTIDEIDNYNFEYRPRNLFRGAFDWNLNYQEIPAPKENYIKQDEHFTSPIITGQMFAINANFFWKLLGFNEKLMSLERALIDLSFKIWLCGGVILNDPCSRIGRIAKVNMRNNFRYQDNKIIAASWMDIYAKYVYQRHPFSYSTISSVSVLKLILIKHRFKCQSFKWYLSIVAQDSLKYYPPYEKPLEYGFIQNLRETKMCLETFTDNKFKMRIKLNTCSRSHYNSNQTWMLSWRNDLRLYDNDYCIEINKSTVNSNKCNGLKSQYWQYEKQKQWLTHKNKCLEANMKTRSIHLNDCNEENLNMKWHIGDLLNISEPLNLTPNTTLNRSTKVSTTISSALRDKSDIVRLEKTTIKCSETNIPIKSTLNSQLKPTIKPLLNNEDVFASGLIQSLSNKKLCLDASLYLKSKNSSIDKRISLEFCSDPKTPVKSQTWALTLTNYLKLKNINNSLCLEISSTNTSIVQFDKCNLIKKMQLWSFDLKKKHIYQKHKDLCLTSDIEHKKVYMQKCDGKDVNMQWYLLGFFNETAFKQIEKRGK